MHEDTQAQPSRMGEVLKNRQLLNLDFGIFALHAAQMALFTALPFAMTQLGLEKIHHWQVYLPSTITGLIIMVPLIIVGETRNKLKQVFILGIICIAAAQIGLLFGHALGMVNYRLSDCLLYWFQCIGSQPAVYGVENRSVRFERYGDGRV